MLNQKYYSNRREDLTNSSQYHQKYRDQNLCVHEYDFHRRMKALILPDRIPARYRFTIDFAGSALAEFGEQHKHLHIMEMEDGGMGTFPNNRVLWVEPAMWEQPLTDRPDFLALSGEFMAE